MLLCDPARYFFCSRWAFLSDQPSRVVSTRLAIYNSKSFKPNRSASPFRKKDLATFKSSYPTSLMAQSFACHSPCQNPHDGKDELTGGTFTKGSNRCTLTPAATRVSISAVTPVVAPFVASGSTDSSGVRYSEDDFQRILKTVLDPRSRASIWAPVVTAAPHYKGLYERSLKAWFPDICWDKTHLEYYNFFQQCKDYFANAGAMGPNLVLFRLFSWRIPPCFAGSNTSVR